MARDSGKRYLNHPVYWLLLGLAAGFLLSAAVTYQEYQSFSQFAGAVIRQEAQTQNAQLQEERIQDTETNLRKILASALKQQAPEDRKTGETWLHEYGYHTWRRLGVHIPYLSVLSVLLFEAVGWCVFLRRKREQEKREQRIEELREYLLAANQGKAGVLRRREDEFSYLEDEIYKAVMELKGTKEEAVHNHEVLSERIADIAHQLKTPITSMSLMTELLEDQQTEEGKECLQRLALQNHRLQNLVSSLLSLAKLESHTIQFKAESVDIEAVIDGAAEPLQELIQKKQLCLEMSGEPVCILADRQWIEEAMLNVLKNCVEHSPVGGCIRIQWEENPLYAEIRVTDCGKGFAKKDLPHLFERFYRGEDAQKDSAGIGLALAKLVVEQQNGHIHAENTIEGHACFMIRFYRS